MRLGQAEVWGWAGAFGMQDRVFYGGENAKAARA